MIALARESTVPAFPLGIPTDGRQRFSMTFHQAAVYRWLVACRPHGEPFALNFRAMATEMGWSLSTLHLCVQGLVERGWLHVVLNGRYTHYGFVHPIKQFKGPRYVENQEG